MMDDGNLYALLAFVLQLVFFRTLAVLFAGKKF